MTISRHKLANFRKEASPLLELVTSDIYLESIWLSTMAMLENIAAQYILSNITDATPKNEIIHIMEHIKDEQRHAQALLDMRPATSYPETRYYDLEKEWHQIGREFIMAFFNSALLRKANHRHAAYVHGAQTIERFPFRIYSLYLKMTKIPAVHEILPRVIADEYGHIELGQKMYAQLSSTERMPLTNLYRLEEDLCLMMLRRMHISLSDRWSLTESEHFSPLEKKIIHSSQFEIAWNYSLSSTERHFSAPRSLALKSANTLLRTSVREEPGYRELESKLVNIISKYTFTCLEAGLSEETILARLDDHYEKMIYQTNNIALHYAYYRILEDHKVESIVSEEKMHEEKIWNCLISEIIQLDAYENSVHLSRA